MSKSISAKLTFSLLMAAFVAVALLTSDFSDVLAQNSNSSTTTEESEMQNSNTNTNVGRRGGRRRGRRGTRRPASTESTSDTTGTSDGTGTPSDTTMTSGQTSTTGDMTNTSGGETTDLSGTYTGRLSMPEHGVTNEEGTLTITGNQYTLTAGSMSHSGRISANTTRGYTGVALELGPGESGQPAPFVSLRARRRGTDGLSLTSVPGEKHKLTFTTAGMGGGGGRRRRR